ncbi:Rieske 2Fe-2S domain-containing protein [Streptomyces malaysiensis subsp. malaysiensis]
MLRKDINELLTRTGPGTAMGELFRQYWIPAMLAEELPETDCPPVRVKLLSERLVAFRDSEGRYGLVDEFCAHRGASLWFGRNEEGGLRCPYHGWKYDVSGQCVDVPSEADNSSFCQNVKLTSYPLVKIGDVLWTYMGDAATQPPLPEFEWTHVPAEQTYTSSAGSSATGSRRSRAASTPAMSPSSTRAASRPTRSSRARRATSTT